jgi:coenzyme F420-reducing hydrogenase beta subunit
MQIKDSNKLLKSTSGGMFTCLAEYVLSRGGVVYGAVYNKNMRVIHVAASQEEDLDAMHGSKYVQSDIYAVYGHIKSLIDEKRLVLFTGLPCQVAGIRAFLRFDSDYLITMDLICSGVPSPWLFQQYILYLQNKYKIKIFDYKFRDKERNGCSHTVVVRYRDFLGRERKKTISNRRTVSYYVAFGKENCFMKACYSCKYNSLSRVSDFTVGGFWGLGNTHTEFDFNEKEGVSLVLANTNKAKEIINALMIYAVFESIDAEHAIVGNRALWRNTSCPPYREALFAELQKSGYRRTYLKYFRPDRKIIIMMRNVAREVLQIFGKKSSNGSIER